MAAKRLAPKRLKPCWHCGAFTPFQCARCKKPVCVLGYYFGGPKLLDVKAACSTLRKRRSETGVYLLCCWPKCVKRRSKTKLQQLTPAEYAEQKYCAETGDRCPSALECDARGVCKADLKRAAREMHDDMMGTGAAEDDQP